MECTGSKPPAPKPQESTVVSISFLQIRNRFFNFTILRTMDYSMLFRFPVITGELSGQAVHQ